MIELTKQDNLAMQLDLRVADLLTTLWCRFHFEDDEGSRQVAQLIRLAYCKGYVEAAQEVRIGSLGMVDVDKMSLFVDTAYRCPS